MKLTGKRSAGNPHATFDEAEAGNVLITLSGAPVFDPTDEGELEIEPLATTPALYSTRIIPRSGGFNTPQLAAESVSKACFGVHARDSRSNQ